LLKHLVGPTSGRTALILAAVLAFPFCFTGLFADDYMQQLVLEGNPVVPTTKWELFTFAKGDPATMLPLITNGPYSWWTLPEIKFSFLRPLSCALAQFDTWAFGRAWFLHHLHSLAWYLALVAVVTALLRRSLGLASPIAAIAAILFAIDDSHAVIVGWVANRNALIATAPVLLGVLAHLWWRERGALIGLPLSLLLCGVGLMGAEVALGAIAYLIAYELTIGPGTWRQRALALLPLSLLGVAYIATYKLMGAGAYGSEMYIDPLRDPLRFLTLGVPKFFALIGAQFLATTADLWLVYVPARPVLVVFGVVALLFMIVLVRRVWPKLEESERRGLKWLTVGGALSIVPVLATFPLNRLLLMPSIGGSALLAAVLWHGWKTEDRLLRYGTRVLFFSTVVVALFSWPSAAFVLNLGASEQKRAAMETKLSDEVIGGRVFVFVAPDPMASLYVPLIRVWHGKPGAKQFVTFSFAPWKHRLTRVSSNVFELEVVEGRLLETVFEQLMRSSQFPLSVGTTVQLNGADVTVLSLNEGLPNKLSIHFDEEPERGSYTLASWEDGMLSAMKVPAVGETVELERLRSVLSP
jgi:hypothetical protein